MDGKVYDIEIYCDGVSLGDKDLHSDLGRLYRTRKDLHLGRTRKRSRIVTIDGHKYQARRVFAGLYA